MVRDSRLTTSSHAQMPSWERPRDNSLRGEVQSDKGDVSPRENNQGEMDPYGKKK